MGVHAHIELAVTAGVDAQLVGEDVNGAVFDTLEIDRGATSAEMDFTIGGILNAHRAEQTWAVKSVKE